MSGVPDHILDEIASMLRAGSPAMRLREIEERVFKHRIVPVGVYFPFRFPADEWDVESVVSQDGNDIRLVLVTAAHPGAGAFSRLVAAIKNSGLTPVVCAPVGPTMPVIMRKWGWKRSLCHNKEFPGWPPGEEWRSA